MEPDFYIHTLRRLQATGWLRPQDRVLVVCAGPPDRDALLAVGQTNAVISNLDERMTDDGRYAPLEWSHQDAEALTYDSESFDICIVHDGLHHCLSPHRGLLEMLRVARRGVLAFEPRDTGIVRLGVRLKFGQRYETSAVEGGGLKFGGVRNTPVPNYVHRWTEREIEKTVRAASPEGAPSFEYFYALRVPEERLRWLRSPVQRRLVQVGLPAMKGLSRVFPRQTNGFAFAITKPALPRDMHPWLRLADDGVAPDPVWFEDEYRRGPKRRG